MFFKRNKNNQVSDYRAIFLMGLIWTVSGLPIALTSQSHALLLMGLVFLGLGYANKNQWPEAPKKDSPETQRKIFILAAVTVIIVLVNIMLIMR